MKINYSKILDIISIILLIFIILNIYNSCYFKKVNIENFTIIKENNNNLTKYEQDILDGFINGNITTNDIPKKINGGSLTKESLKRIIKHIS